MKAALGEFNFRIAENPDFADGMSSSLRVGVRAVPPDADAALVVLGDMPLTTADDIRSIVRIFFAGRRRHCRSGLRRKARKSRPAGARAFSGAGGDLRRPRRAGRCWRKTPNASARPRRGPARCWTLTRPKRWRQSPQRRRRDGNRKSSRANSAAARGERDSLSGLRRHRADAGAGPARRGRIRFAGAGQHRARSPRLCRSGRRGV